VKVDVQCRIDELKNGYDRGRLLPAYQRAFALSGVYLLPYRLSKLF
jgi:hypothetical protein